MVPEIRSIITGERNAYILMRSRSGPIDDPSRSDRTGRMATDNSFRLCYGTYTAPRVRYISMVIAFVKSDGAVNLFREQKVDTVTGKTTEKIGWDTGQKSKAHAIGTLK